MVSSAAGPIHRGVAVNFSENKRELMLEALRTRDVMPGLETANGVRETFDDEYRGTALPAMSGMDQEKFKEKLLLISWLGSETDAVSNTKPALIIGKGTGSTETTGRKREVIKTVTEVEPTTTEE
jgi:hypothetical protein